MRVASFIIAKMSEEESPAVAMMTRQVEKEANETREKLRSAHKAQQNSTDAASEKIENGPSNGTDVKINVEDSKLFEKKVSIFGMKKGDQNAPDIFGSKKSVNLFNLPQGSSAAGSVDIFRMAVSSQPSVLDKDEEEENGSVGSSSEKDHQAMPEPTEKVMKYSYQERTEKVAEFRLVKFKKNQDPVKEGLVLSLERDKKATSKALYFILRNQMTKVSVFQGLLLPQTQLRPLGGESNWKLDVIRVKGKGEDGKVEAERDVVKLQFEDGEKAQQFKQVVCGSPPQQ